MIPITEFTGRDVAVFGLARTGLAAARALTAGGARVHAWDDNEAARAKAEAVGVPVTDINNRDWRTFAALILSPGVPLTLPEPHRVVTLADAVGVPVLGDIELFARAVNVLPAAQRPKLIGITGTNGKSTTSALIAHILKEAGKDVRLGGNIGESVLDLEPLHAGAFYVIELSSFQLDLTQTLRLDVAVWLNTTPDHLDRHGDMPHYVASKRQVFANQGAADWAVIGVDDEYCATVCTELTRAAVQHVAPISAGQVLGRGVSALGPKIIDALNGRCETVADLSNAPALSGRHNAQNAAAAYAATRALGVDARIIANAFNSFPGLPHRLERVATIQGVRFINDSKATNANATAQALAVYPRIYWIAGGVAKEGGIADLAGFFPRIARAYLIGQAAGDFSDTLRDKAAVTMAGTLEAAVKLAFDDARASGEPHPVVLLSPACASYDQFLSYEERGDKFKGYVAGLAGGERNGARKSGGARMIAAVQERFGAAMDRVRTYDRPLIVIAGILLLLGILFSMATSPVATARIRIGEAFYFAARQAAYAALGLIVMLAAASLDPRRLRRAATIIFLVALPLCILAALFGSDVRGARRWFDFGLLSLQPSEILKPALVVVWAWMLSESMKQQRLPGRAIAIGLYLLSAGALLSQPDIGQTALLALVLGPMLILSGMALRWLLGGAALAGAAGLAIYQVFPHARERVDAFLHPETGYQVGRALDAIASGGVFGRGPGEGIVKRSLPDAHADFVFAVAAEEFGMIASLGVIALFGALAFRGLSRASRLNDPFEQLAAAGLVTLLVVQACIHVAVNLSLIPAKGMTLPFISFGGSSMIGSALALGFCLSLLRDRPGAYLYPRSRRD